MPVVHTTPAETTAIPPTSARSHSHRARRHVIEAAKLHELENKFV
jgi:hypothetical protein